MMTLKRKILYTTTLISLFLISVAAFAGDPPPVGGDPTQDPGGTPIGGSAPIGSGIALIVSLGLAYGDRKSVV